MTVCGRETIELLKRTALLTKAMEMPEDMTIVFLAVSDKISTEAKRTLPHEKEVEAMKKNEGILQKKVTLRYVCKSNPTTIAGREQKLTGVDIGDAKHFEPYARGRQESPERRREQGNPGWTISMHVGLHCQRWASPVDKDAGAGRLYPEEANGVPH
jgi:hypothetical protein